MARLRNDHRRKKSLEIKPDFFAQAHSLPDRYRGSSLGHDIVTNYGMPLNIFEGVDLFFNSGIFDEAIQSAEQLYAQKPAKNTDTTTKNRFSGQYGKECQEIWRLSGKNRKLYDISKTIIDWSLGDILPGEHRPTSFYRNPQNAFMVLFALKHSSRLPLDMLGRIISTLEKQQTIPENESLDPFYLGVMMTTYSQLLVDLEDVYFEKFSSTYDERTDSVTKQHQLDRLMRPATEDSSYYNAFLLPFLTSGETITDDRNPLIVLQMPDSAFKQWFWKELRKGQIARRLFRKHILGNTPVYESDGSPSKEWDEIYNQIELGSEFRPVVMEASHKSLLSTLLYSPSITYREQLIKLGDPTRDLYDVEVIPTLMNELMKKEPEKVRNPETYISSKEPLRFRLFLDDLQFEKAITALNSDNAFPEEPFALIDYGDYCDSAPISKLHPLSELNGKSIRYEVEKLFSENMFGAVFLYFPVTVDNITTSVEIQILSQSAQRPYYEKQRRRYIEKRVG